MSTPRFICFDLGGVLIRICRDWAEGCSAAGLPVREGVADMSLVQRRRDLFDDYQSGRIPCRAFFPMLAEATGGLYMPEEAMRVHDAWLLGEYPNVATLLERLSGQSVGLGILSNTNERHWRRLHEFPAAFSIPHRHASHVMGSVKPRPAIFRMFEQEVGCTGSDILFFDDLVANVEAACRAGWQAERIDHDGDTAAQMTRIWNGTA